MRIMNDKFEEKYMNSPLRQSLFNWYDFDPEGALLEIGADFGTVTGFFSGKLRSVTAVAFSEEEKKVTEERVRECENVSVVYGRLPDVLLSVGREQGLLHAGYDYIVVKDCFYDKPAEILRACMMLLKPEGRLLALFTNRYGMKYFCGAKDPFTGVVFDGVGGYLRSDTKYTGRGYSHSEVENILRETGVDNYKFYYPLPDSRMPQVICTDDYRNGKSIAERLVDYDYQDRSVFIPEHRMLSEVIDDGALGFMANSFLVEICADTGIPKNDVIFAVTTTDRGEKYGVVTSVRRDGRVIKRPIYKEGEKYLKRLYKYTEKLKARCVPVIPVELCEDKRGLYIEMEYMDKEPLSDALVRIVKEDKKLFFDIFDEIKEYIDMSADVSNNDEGEEVLLNAYIDLAPLNAFYIGGEFGRDIIFYDQEFVAQYCPVLFPIYRTLFYFYQSKKEVEQYVPLSEMYERYGIDDEMKAYFAEIEKDFIYNLRQFKKYEGLFEIAAPDYDRFSKTMNDITVLLSEDASKDMSEEKKKTSNEAVSKPYHIGYVPGVYDLFHKGHLILFERCKERCDYLIVGVLTDELVEYYKGKKPVISYEDRARVIEGLRCVDEVVPVDFSNTDKIAAWEQLHYDCHFSGNDHANHWNDIIEELHKRGAEMEFFPYTEGISSTSIKKSVKNASSSNESK